MQTLSHTGIALPAPIEYRRKRVITFAMIDELHRRPTGTARRTFTQHRERFAEGRHYVIEKIGTFNVQNARSGHETVLLFEHGYLLLVKPFRDDLSWQIQEILIDGYFRVLRSGIQPLEYLSMQIQPAIKEKVLNLLAEEPQLSTKELSELVGMKLKRRAIYELREARRRKPLMQLMLPGFAA